MQIPVCAPISGTGIKVAADVHNLTLHELYSMLITVKRISGFPRASRVFMNGACHNAPYYEQQHRVYRPQQRWVGFVRLAHTDCSH